MIKIGNPEADESVNNHDGSYNGENNGGTVSLKKSPPPKNWNLKV